MATRLGTGRGTVEVGEVVVGERGGELARPVGTVVEEEDAVVGLDAGGGGWSVVELAVGIVLLPAAGVGPCHHHRRDELVRRPLFVAPGDMLRGLLHPWSAPLGDRAVGKFRAGPPLVAIHGEVPPRHGRDARIRTPGDARLQPPDPGRGPRLAMRHGRR